MRGMSAGEKAIFNLGDGVSTYAKPLAFLHDRTLRGGASGSPSPQNFSRREIRREHAIYSPW